MLKIEKTESRKQYDSPFFVKDQSIL